VLRYLIRRVLWAMVLFVAVTIVTYVIFYAIPANLATVALYYNKTMFTAAGITDPPKTADDFVADVKKLTLGGANPTQYGISLADHQTIEMWPILQWMNGGDIVGADGRATINSAASVQALSTWAGLVQNGHVSPVGQTGADADTLFSAGSRGFRRAGHRGLDGADDDRQEHQAQDRGAGVPELVDRQDPASLVLQGLRLPALRLWARIQMARTGRVATSTTGDSAHFRNRHVARSLHTPRFR